MSSPENKQFTDTNHFSDLRDALKDEQLQEYLHNKGPLKIQELPHSLASDPKFMAFFGEYDWPIDANAGEIAPVHDYNDAVDFWKNVYGGDDEAKYMNNFKNWLIAEPSTVFDPSKGMLSIWELNPALHRANVVAEPLFKNLRAIISEVPNYHTHLQEELMAELGEQHPEVQEAAYAAYRLLGRLVTKDDIRHTLKAMGASSEKGEDVTDAHDYLWT